MSETDAAAFELPEPARRLFDAIGAIAADESHPLCVTAATVFFLMLGKMRRGYLYEDNFVNSPEMNALLAALSGALDRPCLASA